MRDTNKMNIEKLRQSQIDWLETLEFDYFVTLVTNWPNDLSKTNSVHIDKRATKLLKKLNFWEAHVNRSMLGPKWQRHQNRFFAVYSLENLETNIHAHLLIKLKKSIDEERLEDLIDSIWTRLVPRGSINLQPVVNIRGAITYIVKEAHLPGRWDTIDTMGKP